MGLFILVAGSIFVAEVLDLFLLSLLPPFTTLQESLFDGLVLSALMFPVLYFFLSRVPASQTTELNRAGEEGAADLAAERRQLGERRRQSQKMEAIGRLAGGVAHDFNNVLTVIKGNSQLLLSDLDPNDPRRTEVEEIMQAAERAVSLTRQLLAFSRGQALQPVVLDLNARVTDVERMLRRLIGAEIELVTVLDPALGAVRADPGQIEQVIMNLAVNARDAMPQGGVLTIETANTYLDEGYDYADGPIAPGPYVVLAVSDTGIGMDEETESYIFEPFFTTKQRGSGTGLGLATVYGIVKQSGSYICIDSEPGQGTRFSIYLPRVERSVEALPASAAPGEPLQGSETILLVEDDKAVRRMAGEVLERGGYTVLEARHGREALQLCKRHTGRIHLMVTDMVMPEMGGRELAERLARLRPAMRVVYVSGYSSNADVTHGVFAPDTPLLQKPFESEALLRTVREVIDAPAETVASSTP